MTKNFKRVVHFYKYEQVVFGAEHLTVAILAKTKLMRKILLLLLLCATGLTGFSQKWSTLSDEQKLMKLQAFREDNQEFLKTKLGMTEDQRIDIDNVNICFLAALDRISVYGKDDATKEKWADIAIQARLAQLEMIMGADKRKQYQDFVMAKLKKAAEKAGN